MADVARMSIVEELRHYGKYDGMVFDKPVLARKLRKAADEIEGLLERMYPPQHTMPDWKWWCMSCGSLSNDGECDCTRHEETADHQRLVRNP